MGVKAGLDPSLMVRGDQRRQRHEHRDHAEVSALGAARHLRLRLRHGADGQGRAAVPAGGRGLRHSGRGGARRSAGCGRRRWPSTAPIATSPSSPRRSRKRAGVEMRREEIVGRQAMSDDIYEIFAVRYAEHQRKAAENYIGGDPHDVLQPLDYFVWVIRNDQRTFVVDTGFDQPVGTKRGPHRDHAGGRGAQAPRHRSRHGRERHHQPHALRPLRQRRSVPARPLSRAGQGDAVLHRPLHVPPAAARLV